MKRALLALLLATPSYGQTYEPALVQPVILGTPTTMTPLNLGDDNTRKLDLGFEFPYWDQTFTSAWVSSNGFISFQSGDHMCCEGQPLSQAQRNTIYGFWTDLVSGGNPYYRRTDSVFLVGWYGTKEYGTNNSETFQISLFKDGNIQFDFGAVTLSYHAASAGITGPTADDNIQLFYGRDASGLRYQSGLLSFAGAQKVDCVVTPMDPSCPPATVSFAPSPAVQQAVAEVVTIAEAYQADVAADVSDIAAATISEPAQVIDIAAQVETPSITEQVAAKEAAPEAERLSPDQVAALSATQSADVGQQALASADPVQMSMVGASAAASTSSGVGGAIDAATSSSSPSSVANTNEVLAMSTSSTPAASSQPDQQQSAAGQQDDFAAMSASPGFAAYTQVSLQDRPDFYAVRDIYRNRRLRDANFEMYRMSQTNNAKWREMVDEQYGR
jgi:hypothetical protein